MHSENPADTGLTAEYEICRIRKNVTTCLIAEITNIFSLVRFKFRVWISSGCAK